MGNKIEFVACQSRGRNKDLEVHTGTHDRKLAQKEVIRDAVVEDVYLRGTAPSVLILLANLQYMRDQNICEL